jgi:hypothetical protein
MSAAESLPPLPCAIVIVPFIAIVYLYPLLPSIFIYVHHDPYSVSNARFSPRHPFAYQMPQAPVTASSVRVSDAEAPVTAPFIRVPNA